MDGRDSCGAKQIPQNQRKGLTNQFFDSFIASRIQSIHLGYDPGDEVWDNEKEREWLATWFKEKFPDGSDKGDVLLSLHVYDDIRHDDVCATNNVTLSSAFDEGFDYFYRLNDDSRFISPK